MCIYIMWMNVIIPMNNHPQMVYCVANILSISIIHHPSSIIIIIIITIITTTIIISSSNIFWIYTLLQRNMHNVLYIYIIPHYIMIASTISTWVYFSILCLYIYIAIYLCIPIISPFYFQCVEPKITCFSLPIGSMYAIYMVTWIPSIYPQC